MLPHKNVGKVLLLIAVYAVWIKGGVFARIPKNKKGKVFYINRAIIV